MNVEKVKQRIIDHIQKEVDTAVVGLSGGADSLTVALLSMESLGKENVYAFSLPFSDYDLKTFNQKSRTSAEHIGVHHRIISIGKIADAANTAIAGAFDQSAENLSPVNAGNARARARMTVLYGAAHHLADQLNRRVRVMGTGNLSEDFIGYDTKGGDALADIFPIGHLFKSEVYQMLEHYRDTGVITEEMINRKPSAGLWEGQTDEEEIGYTYNEMQGAIERLLADYDNVNISALSDMEAFVWQRHLANKHKHAAPPVIPLRDVRGKFIND